MVSTSTREIGEPGGRPEPRLRTPQVPGQLAQGLDDGSGPGGAAVHRDEFQQQSIPVDLARDQKGTHIQQGPAARVLHRAGVACEQLRQRVGNGLHALDQLQVVAHVVLGRRGSGTPHLHQFHGRRQSRLQALPDDLGREVLLNGQVHPLAFRRQAQRHGVLENKLDARVEALCIGHGQVGPTQAAFHQPDEIQVAEEAGITQLAQAQPRGMTCGRGDHGSRLDQFVVAGLAPWAPRTEWSSLNDRQAPNKPRPGRAPLGQPHHRSGP